MPITDLLWACPECGGALTGRGRTAVCEGCGARYQRAAGARIRREREGETPVTRRPAEWVDLLPDVATLLEGEDPVRETRVRVRIAEDQQPVRVGGRYIGHVERYGEREAGRLRLDGSRLVLEAERAMEWPLSEITTIQPSSRALQVRATGSPLVSLEFPEDSVRLWEELLVEALRRHYRRAGKGEIVEFQPRIVTR